ncbi:hypothetical protein, partial [Mycoplasma sp. CSL7503-lung]|uniref:hypothetical protein n=1 Tax=Mycoplasma sp. CSL7503-lung TaxID=536372 RepID=UPI0021D2723E
ETYTSNDTNKITNESRSKIIQNIIKKYYFIDNNTKLYLLSDGAVYFKKLAKMLGAEHVYDYFHFCKRFLEIFKNKIFVFVDKKTKQVLNNSEAKKWLFESLKTPRIFLDKLKHLTNSPLVTETAKKSIKTFVHFMRKNCKTFKFHIHNYTAQAESSVSLFKSIYRKRYSIFSFETIINLIKINQNKKFNFIDFKTEYTNLDEIEFEPIIWTNNQNYHWI